MTEKKRHCAAAIRPDHNAETGSKARHPDVAALSSASACYNPAKGPFAETLKNQFNAIPRFATVEEIAGMVAYLASAEAACITGASLIIDGGFSA